MRLFSAVFALILPVAGAGAVETVDCPSLRSERLFVPHDSSEQPWTIDIFPAEPADVTWELETVVPRAAGTWLNCSATLPDGTAVHYSKFVPAVSCIVSADGTAFVCD